MDWLNRCDLILSFKGFICIHIPSPGKKMLLLCQHVAAVSTVSSSCKNMFRNCLKFFEKKNAVGSRCVQKSHQNQVFRKWSIKSTSQRWWANLGFFFPFFSGLPAFSWRSSLSSNRRTLAEKKSFAWYVSSAVSLSHPFLSLELKRSVALPRVPY